MTELAGDPSPVIPSLIEKATNSTASELNPHLLSAIKSAARSSDLEIRSALDSLLSHLRRPHSHVRYLSLLIADALFTRSSLFRSLLAPNLDQFLALTVGFRRDLPLPPPASIASLLRSKSIEILSKWNAEFGLKYRQLRLGFDYLKNNLKIQFPSNHQQQREERQQRTNQILIGKLEGIMESFELVKEEIKLAVDEIGRCLEIVSVEEVEFDGGDKEEEEEFFSSRELREIRMDSLREAGRVREDNENRAVFDALREIYRILVLKHLVTLQEWISVLVRVDVEDNKFRDAALKECIDLRNVIRSVKKRCDELCGDLGEKMISRGGDEEEDDLWEEGKIEFCNDSGINDAEAQNGSTRKGKIEDCAEKAQSSGRGKGKHVDADSSSNSMPSSSSSLRGKLLAEAPVMTWSPSLDDWGTARDALANQRGLELDNHWGRVDPDAVVPAEKIAELKLHCTVYKEESTEIQPCLAPLRKGGLCQRRDLRVCPFHGPIVPRDAEGNPIELEEERSGVAERESSLDEVNVESLFESGKELAEQLAKRAVKNVREREKSDAKSLKRAKLAKVREHNEAVLREAAMVSTSFSAAFGESGEGSVPYGNGSKVKKATLASMLKKKVTAKDRLEKRLLNGRARDAASRQGTQGEDSKYREAFPNQW